MMKNCPNCGTQSDATFCPSCGTMMKGFATSFEEKPLGGEASQPFEEKVMGGDAPQAFAEKPMVSDAPPQPVYAPPAPPVREKVGVELLLCFFLGYFGVHKFYRGKILLGLLYLFTGGLFGIGYVIDLVVLLFKWLRSLF